MKFLGLVLGATLAFSLHAQTSSVLAPKNRVFKCEGSFSEGSQPTQADIVMEPGKYPSQGKVTVSISQSSPMPHSLNCKLEFFVILDVKGVIQAKDLNFVEATQCKSRALVGSDPELEDSWEKTEPLIAWSFEYLGSNYNVSSFEYENIFKVKSSGDASNNNIMLCKEKN